MDNKEKYYKFIVDDLVRNTDIDYDTNKIKLPTYSNHIRFPGLITLQSLHPSIFYLIQTKYGANNEEIKNIWAQYRDRILTLIDNG